MKQSNLIQRKKLLSGSPIRRRGKKADAWKAFRDEKALRDRDEDGDIACQDSRIGLRRCGNSLANPDLHHVFGRDGNLLFDEKNMVWLTRSCHQKAHENIGATREAYDTWKCT